MVGISTLITGMVLLFENPMPGWSSPMQNIKAGNYFGMVQSIIASLTGLRISGGGQGKTQFHINEVINPLDFKSAPALKVAIVSHSLLKIAKKYVSNPFAGIPIIKDILSFS